MTGYSYQARRREKKREKAASLLRSARMKARGLQLHACSVVALAGHAKKLKPKFKLKEFSARKIDIRKISIRKPKQEAPITDDKKAAGKVLANTMQRVVANRIQMPVKHNLMDSVSFKKIFLIWISFMIFFGIVYFSVDMMSPQNGLLGIDHFSPVQSLIDSIYFSFITATSTGFGDISPTGLSRLISIVEVVCGMIMFGIVISKLVSYKQEAILSRVYDISFDERLNRMRSALYLFRSDIGRITDIMEEGKIPKGLITHLWSTISAMHETLIETDRMICMPSSKETEFMKRADSFQLELMLNSIRLCMKRLSELLVQMNSSSYKWRSEKNVETVKSVVYVVSNICAYHKLKHESANINKRISEIEALKVEIKKRI